MAVDGTPLTVRYPLSRRQSQKGVQIKLEYFFYPKFIVVFFSFVNCFAGFQLGLGLPR